MGILLCEQNFRDVWIRNKSVRAEIGQILRTHTQTHTHTTAAKLVVRIGAYSAVLIGAFSLTYWFIVKIYATSTTLYPTVQRHNIVTIFDTRY